LATVAELGDKVGNSATLVRHRTDLRFLGETPGARSHMFDTVADKDKKLSKTKNQIRDCSPVLVFLLPASGLLQLQTMTR
jgi:hypothetical protein